MVFEQLYSAAWIEKKSRYAFLMGLGYSVLGIATAMFIFPSEPGIAAIALTSLLILPSLSKLLSIEANEAAREQKFNIFKMFKEHKDIVKIYFFLFLGTLVAFSFFSIVWPSLATSRIFSQQAGVLGTVGHAVYSKGLFHRLISNNLKVLIVCLVASLFYGAGAIFVIIWNASVWGVVFGLIAKNSAAASGANAFVIFAITIAAVFPHMIFEALSYFLAAISGGIISKAVIREKLFTNRFNHIMEDGLLMFVIAVVVLVIAAVIEAFLTGHVVNLFGL